MRKQIYRYPLALFAAGLLAACSGDKNEGTDKEGVETVLPAQQNEVTVMTLKKTTFSQELVSNGKVEARQQAD